MPDELNGVSGLETLSEGEPVLTRDRDAKLGRKARVERDEVRAQRLAPLAIEARGERTRRSVTCREGVPRGFGSRLAIVGDALFEPQREGAAEQLAEALGVSPL